MKNTAAVLCWSFTYSRKTEAGNFQEEQDPQQAFEFEVFLVHVLIHNRIGLHKKKEHFQTYNLIINFYLRFFKEKL